jgi:hypothetical protein
MIIVNFKGGERNGEKRKFFASNVYPFLILKYHQIRLQKIRSNKRILSSFDLLFRAR